MLRYLAALLPAYILLYLPLTQYFGLNGPATDAVPFVFNATFIVPRGEQGLGLGLGCEERRYVSRVVSVSPLVVYVEGFVGGAEAERLLDASAALFAPSLVTSGTTSYINATVRNSLVATPPRTPLVQCIEARALAFQGGAASLRGKNVPLQLERLKVQKYGVGGRYEWHYDWAGGRARADRWGSWMVWLKGEGEGVRGGGTEFPRLRRPGGREWCRFIECEGEDGVGVEDENGKRGEKEWEPAGKMRADGRVGERYEDNGSGRWRGEELGVTFKPIAGNAVFWVNLREDGSGWEETWHKGCEVVEGEKVGLNIWSWVVY